MTIAEKFGKRIRALRKERKLTQEALAERSGLHNTYIGQIERGEKNPSLESIEKLSVGLDVSVAELFETFADKPRSNPEIKKLNEMIEKLPPKTLETLLNMVIELVKIMR